MKSRLTEAQALRWFEMLAMYDQQTPPDEWHWGEYDLAANAALNSSLFHPPRRFAFFGEKAQPPWNTSPPPPRNSWRSTGIRLPLSHGAPWTPSYFPDATTDIAIIHGKHTWVMGSSAVMLEHIKATFRTCSQLVTSAEQAETQLRGGAVLFSFGRYVEFLHELHSRYPDFSRSPATRVAAFDSWQQGCLATTPQEVSSLMEWRDLLAVNEAYMKFIGLPFSR